MATTALATGEAAATDLAASRTPTATTAESFESDVPTIETAAYARTKARLGRNRDVFDGTEAIQAAGTKYLPQFNGESAAHYDARRTISAVFNGFSRTVDAIEGLVCEPEPTLSKDMPAPLVVMWENADGAGMHGAVLTRRLVRSSTVDGFAGILTEYPRVSEADLTRQGVSAAARVALAEGKPFDGADVAAMGLRPYFILVKVDECLPIYETVNGKRTLVMFIRRYTMSTRKGQFGRTSELVHDVYELTANGVMFERWVDVDGKRTKKDGPTKMRNLTAIPWSPLALGKQKGDHEYKPTLDDLAFLTITHHRIATGILSLEEAAFVPTKWRVGAPKDNKGNYPELVVGSEHVIEIPMPPPGVSLPNPPVGYLSPPVDVLEPAKWSLDNCKAEMGAMGAAFLTPQPAQETATAHRMDATAEQANVATMSRDTKDCLESAFGFAGQYIGQPGGSITMSNDFTGAGIDAQVLAILVTNYQSDRPIVTLEDVRHYLKTGQLPEGFDPDNTLGLLALTAQLAKDKAEAARAALTAPTADATNPADPTTEQQ
jgi:hypothetical protein